MTALDWTRRSALGLPGAAALGLSACAHLTRTTTDAGFEHGVASGDPGPDRLIIWTRVTPSTPDAAASNAPVVDVRWVIANDAALNDIVRDGTVRTGAERDYTVKVDADGLAPGVSYFYGFFVGATASPVGRGRTLPVGRLDTLTLAAVSCSNHPVGYFHAYADIAEQGVDVVLHLGDYIYEYGVDALQRRDGAAYARAQRLGRLPEPPHELLTLADYRTRYAQYRRDPDLQAAHAAAPWITIWDDHESADNSWSDGAQNHDPWSGEGAWSHRKAAAVQAYLEWLPIRDPAPGRAREAIWRAFAFGDLATLIMLETRLTGRTQQVSMIRDMPLQETAYDVSDPNAPAPLLSDAAVAAVDPKALDRLPTPFDVTQSDPTPITDYARVRAMDPQNPPEGVAFLPDVARFRADVLNDPERRMLAPAQEAFVNEQLMFAALDAQRWRLIGNPVLMTRLDAPNFAQTLSAETKAVVESRYPGIGQYFELSRLGAPWNTDAWDGYGAQRDRLLRIAGDTDDNLLVLTGDTHAFWAARLQHPDRDSAAGVEFGTTGVSSNSVKEMFGIAEPLGELFAEANETILYNEQTTRGWLRVRLTRDDAVADMIAVSDVSAPRTGSRVLKSWRVTRGPVAVSELS